MGTYTNNYNLFMPSIGEQGWGELVNGNFTTIDTTMAGLNTRIGTLETETDAVEERVTTLEAGDFETINVAGNIVADSVTADLSPCFELTSESGVISSFYTDSSVQLATASQYNGGNQTKTYTYRKSAINDTCTLRAHSYYSGKVVFYVNNTEVLSHQIQYTGTDKTVEVTLNDGDIVTCACTYANDSSQAQGYIEFKGYLVAV